MNEEFSGDEYLPLMFSGFVAVAGFMSWYVPAARVAVLGRGRNDRWSLFLAPLVCLGQIWFVLEFLAAGEVRRSGGYVFYFVVMGAGWLTVAFWPCSLLGVSFREDVLERDNPAAAAVVGGAMEAVTLGYAGANIGEGATVWRTIYPASIATGTLFVLWLVVEQATKVSVAVTVDRDVASGVRLAGWLVSVGLILGRAVAGDWESVSAMWRDFELEGSPAVAWAFAAIIAEAALRPNSRQPFPSPVRYGVAPALLYLAAAVGYVRWLGPWTSGRR